MLESAAKRRRTAMELEVTQQHLRCELTARYGVAPASARVVFAPYRICPLGAHIDHQLGPVTAMAIDRGVLLAYASSTAREVRLGSMEFAGEVRFDLDRPGAPQPRDWGNYARGAVQALRRAGLPLSRGLVGVMTGPWSESGLSSSAAVGVACLLALEDVNALRVAAGENILLDQAIENDYLGLKNGVLDQSGILLSRKDYLTLVDCATNRHELVPPAQQAGTWSIVLAFSGLKQALTGTDYNRRVAECAAAARILLDAAGRLEANALLGCVRESEYAEHKNRLPHPLDRRAEHFFSEVERVRQGVLAWSKGDLPWFGRLMAESGESSIRNYQCGSPPLVDLYELLVRCPGVYGARFSGAGFRGCCVALVSKAAAQQIAEAIVPAYARRQPDLAVQASVEICRSDDGARFLGGPAL
jgi:galactokinase